VASRNEAGAPSIKAMTNTEKPEPEANLGLATTRELLLEIQARGDVLMLMGRTGRASKENHDKGADGSVLSALAGAVLRSTRPDVLDYRTEDNA
jgi:hypothetical protein